MNFIKGKNMSENTNEIEKIVFETDEGQEEFFVLDETRIRGINYILVTNSDDVEAEEIEVLILKDISEETDPESVYEVVEDEEELQLVAELFEESMGDVDIE